MVKEIRENIIIMFASRSPVWEVKRHVDIASKIVLEIVTGGSACYQRGSEDVYGVMKWSIMVWKGKNSSVVIGWWWWRKGGLVWIWNQDVMSVCWVKSASCTKWAPNDRVYSWNRWILWNWVEMSTGKWILEKCCVSWHAKWVLCRDCLSESSGVGI